MDALSDAIYRTVHDGHPRGAVGLGPLVGVKANYLNNKADPAHDAELTCREAIPLMRQTGDVRILATMAAAVDHGIIPLGDYSQCTDVEILDLYCKLHAELGETAQAIRAALAAGKVSRSAVRTVRREVIEDIQAAFAVVARLEALVEVEDDA